MMISQLLLWLSPGSPRGCNGCQYYTRV